MSKLLTTGILAYGSEELQQLLIQLYRRLGKNVTVEASYDDDGEIEVYIREVETKDLTGLGTEEDCLPNVDDEFVSAPTEKLEVGDLVIVDDRHQVGIGDMVRLRSNGAKGRLIALNGDMAKVEVECFVHTSLDNLELIVGG